MGPMAHAKTQRGQPLAARNNEWPPYPSAPELGATEHASSFLQFFSTPLWCSDGLLLIILACVAHPNLQGGAPS